MSRKFLTPVDLAAGSTAPTPTAGDNSTKLATTAYVEAAVAAGGGGGGDAGVVAQVVQNASATFALSDVGKHWLKNNTSAYTWTIPLNSAVAFSLGATILLVNDGTSGNVTVARTSGVALMNSSTNSNYTLAPGTSRTIIKIGTDRWRLI